MLITYVKTNGETFSEQVDANDAYLMADCLACAGFLVVVEEVEQ